jgi:hypothetical protein
MRRTKQARIMDNTDIRPGDIVRLTNNTLLGGKVIKVEQYENKDEYGIVSYEYGGTSGIGSPKSHLALLRGIHTDISLFAHGAKNMPFQTSTRALVKCLKSISTGKTLVW